MAITVDIEGGGTVEFPDGTSPATIKAAMDKQFGGGSSTADIPSATNNPTEYEKQRMAFVRGDAALPTRIKEEISNITPSRKTLAGFARPTLEGTGAALGGIGGSMTATPIVGGVIGAGLGYATGKKLADFIEGTPQPDNLADATVQTLNDVSTGATYEMGGQLAGKGIAKLADFAKGAKIPFTDSWTKQKAGTILNERLQPTVEAVNTQAATNDLLSRLNTDAVPTPAQSTNSRSMAALEQSAIAKDPLLAAQVANNNATMNRAAQANLYESLGNTEVKAIPNQPIAATGDNLLTSIESAQAPVKEAERAAWSAVPDYPMPITTTQETIKTLKSTPMPEEVKNTVSGIMDYMNQLPQTTKGMRAAEETLSGAISKATKSGDMNTARQLYELKNAVRADFDLMGEAAHAGDIALSNGNIVYPSKLAADLAKTEERIVSLGSSQKPDMDAIRQALKDNGTSPNVYRAADKYDTGADTRAVEAYKRFVSQDLPHINGNGAEIEKLMAGREALQTQLSTLQPAEDAAAAIKQARAISLQKNEMFNRGATKDVLQRGDELTGRRAASEAIPGQFFSETGSKDLVRAVGKDEAKKQLAPYVQSQMASFTDNNGVFNIQRGMSWIRQNKNILDVTGNHADAVQVIKDQIPASLKAAIESKAKVDIAGNPILTAREGLKLIREYIPAMKLAYGDKGGQQLGTLRDYQRIISMLGRNQNVTSGGSNTIDKLFGDAPPNSLAGRIFNEVSGAILGTATGAALHGATGASAGAIIGMAAGTGIKAARGHALDSMRKLLADAITNPATAKMLMDIGRGAKITPTQINSHLITLGIAAADPLQ